MKIFEGHKYFVEYSDGTREITEKPIIIKDNISATICTDLTILFGKGNEPDMESFNKIFPNAFYPYPS